MLCKQHFNVTVMMIFFFFLFIILVFFQWLCIYTCGVMGQPPSPLKSSISFILHSYAFGTSCLIPFQLETVWWSTIPSPYMITWLIFALTMYIKTRHTFMLECPLYSMFESVVLGSFKSFFQSNHQVDINPSLSHRLMHFVSLGN